MGEVGEKRAATKEGRIYGEKDVRIGAQPGPTENVDWRTGRENPGKEGYAATEEKTEEEGEREREKLSAKRRDAAGAREEAASGESAKGAAFN